MIFNPFGVVLALLGRVTVLHTVLLVCNPRWGFGGVYSPFNNTVLHTVLLICNPRWGLRL